MAETSISDHPNNIQSNAPRGIKVPQGSRRRVLLLQTCVARQHRHFDNPNFRVMDVRQHLTEIAAIDPCTARLAFHQCSEFQCYMVNRTRGRR
jgi:hypothetical protein